MKKGPGFVLITILVLVFTACGAPAVQETLTPSPDVTEPTPVETPKANEQPTPETVVIFTDTVLEEKIREAMNKSEGDITLAEAEAVTVLDLSIEPGVSLPRIKDISSLKYFPNVTSLILAWALDNNDGGVDISVLANLTKLEALYINCNGIEDISALSGLTNMLDLKIWGNKITDISALSGMTKMQDLWMKGNQITDISVLANMKDLVWLYMDDNQVTDLSPLAELSKLTHLLLSGNPATDYSALSDVYSNLEEKDFKLK